MLVDHAFPCIDTRLLYGSTVKLKKVYSGAVIMHLIDAMGERVIRRGYCLEDARLDAISDNSLDLLRRPH